MCSYKPVPSVHLFIFSLFVPFGPALGKLFRFDPPHEPSSLSGRDYITIREQYNIAFILFMECNLYPNVKGNFKLRLCRCQKRFGVTRTDSRYVPGLPETLPGSTSSYSSTSSAHRGKSAKRKISRLTPPKSALLSLLIFARSLARARFVLIFIRRADVYYLLKNVIKIPRTWKQDRKY